MMKPVPQLELEAILKRAYTLRSKQLEDRSLERGSFEKLYEKVLAGYKNRSVSLFTDDLEDPKSFLLIGLGQSILFDKPTALIYFIGSADGGVPTDELLETAEAYARLYECGDLLVSSWRFAGARDIGKLWERKGFEIQETTYTKIL